MTETERQHVRSAILRAMAAYGLDNPQRAEAAVTAALNAYDETTERALSAPVQAFHDGMPGIDLFRAAEMMGRDPVELEPLLDEAVRLGRLTRFQSWPVVRYAVKR